MRNKINLDGTAKALVFKKRFREMHQVRFWCKLQKWNAFKQKVESKGLKLQDVFNDFIDWFLETDATITTEN